MRPDEQTIETMHQALIDKIKAEGHITSPRVEAAFRAVPRHLFLPEHPPQEVYKDAPIMTKKIDGQFVSSSSQPTMMAIMLEQLDLQPGQHVLEIGAGTGYNAALLAHIVGESGQVVTIDIDEDIVEGARKHLAVAGFEHVRVLCADGGLGYPDAAPYDRILLTVSAADITPAWREQLRPDGRFLMPLAVRGPQISVAFEPRHDEDVPYWQSVSVRPCGFVGLRGAFADESGIVPLSPEQEASMLRLGTHRTFDTTAFLALLKGPSHDIPTFIHVQLADFFWSLSFWLAVHDARFCELIAFDEELKNSLIPNSSNVKMVRAMGLLTGDALALLYPLLEPPPSLSEQDRQQVPSAQDTSSLANKPPDFLLHIKSYGPDEMLAHQLLSLVRDWDQAGHTTDKMLHIRAYARDDAYDNASDSHDILIERKWSSFVFNWQ